MSNIQDVVLTWYYQVIQSDIFMCITVPAIVVAAFYLLYRFLHGVFGR